MGHDGGRRQGRQGSLLAVQRIEQALVNRLAGLASCGPKAGTPQHADRRLTGLLLPPADHPSSTFCRCMALPFYLGAWLAVDM